MDDEQDNEQENSFIQTYMTNYIINYWLYNIIGVSIISILIYWSYSQGHSLLVAILLGLSLDILLIYVSSLVSWNLFIMTIMPYYSVVDKCVISNKKLKL